MSDQIQDKPIISNGIDDFLKFVRNTQSQYRMAEASTREAEDATQDLLHSLELSEHTYHDFAQCAKQLKQVREQRRKGKDTAVVTNLVVEWAEKNAAVIKDLERLLGEVRKCEKNFANRIYTPRTNNVAVFAAQTSGKAKDNQSVSQEKKKQKKERA